MKLVKLEDSSARGATTTAMKSDAGNAPMNMPSGAPGAAPPASGDNAIFVPPEKQQLIGMRSVAAEMGTLKKDIRIVGKVSYDETHLTHIHSKVSGYIEDVFADSVGKSVRAGEPLFTIYSPDLVATEQDYLLALRSRDLLKSSIVASAARGSENLIDAARERLRLWDVTDQEIRSLETEGKSEARDRCLLTCQRRRDGARCVSSRNIRRSVQGSVHDRRPLTCMGARRGL